MNLYQKLFGLNLMNEADDGVGSGGGSVDRGDTLAPATDDAPVVSDEDVKVATGQTEDEDENAQPRDSQGKFAKKERDDEEVRIPKSRYDEQVAKERARAEAAERRLAEIEQQRRQVARGADIGQLEANVKELRNLERKALIAGDDDKAAELSEQADRLNRQIAIEEARDMSVQAKEQAREEIRWDMTVERIEAEYPALDENSEEFDQDLTDDVIDKMNGYMSRDRMPRSQALVKAVQYVMNRRAPVEDQPSGKGLDRGAEKSRKEAAVAKNIDASNRQPASPKKVGADSDKFGKNGPTPEADQMSYEEFSALPDTTKAKMRGDYV